VSIFFTSDTHFGHRHICQFTNRPWANSDEMDDALIAAWNNVVGPGDTVYHLGDFSFAKPSETRATLERLRGNKHLILGNHDRFIRARKSHFVGPKLFASVNDYAEIKPLLPDGMKQRICLFHYGQRVWNGSHHGSIQLHGHSHGTLEPFGSSLDVGVDCKLVTDEYRPISLDEVLAYMSDRETPLADYHGRTGDE